MPARHTCARRVIHGMDVVEMMERVPVDDKHRPKREIKIESVTLHANPLA